MHALEVCTMPALMLDISDASVYTAEFARCEEHFLWSKLSHLLALSGLLSVY